MADKEDRQPTGIATEKPTMLDPATVGLLMKIGADAVAGLKGGKELLASMKSSDLFAIAIEDAKYDEDGDYLLSLKFTNASGHGAYVEQITIAQKQTREGRGDRNPEVDIVKEVTFLSFGHREPKYVRLPLLVPALSNNVTMGVRITPTPGSWVTRDAYGQLEVTVRTLNSEADDPKHLTFAIRHPQANP
jgi:hypothetical protein